MATDSLRELLGGGNCTGSCNYVMVDGVYVYNSGSCDGGPGCESCPQTIDPINSQILRGLVLALGKTCYPNPDDLTVGCSVNLLQLSGSLLPVLKQRRLVNRLTKVTAALGVVSFLLFGGLVYTLLIH